MNEVERELVEDQREQDELRAHELVEAALDPHTRLYRDHGPDRLLAAAQVYATLAAIPIDR